MKIIFIVIAFFVFNIFISAQTVTITGSCYEYVDGDYNLSSDVNGKPSYVHNSSNGNTYYIYWTNTRWEHIASDGYISYIGMYNYSDTPTPPATSLSDWTPDSCNPTGTFAGNGTTILYLNVEEVEQIFTKVHIFPNPSSEYITVFGLKNKENFRVFNYLGVEILNGTVGNNKKIKINSFSNGLYFLKFDNGNTLKFIKK